MTDHTMSNTHASGTPRGTQASYTLNDLERIERSITSAPLPERPLTTSDALAALAPTLSKVRTKGHSLAELVQICAAQGLHVSERAVGRAISTAPTGPPGKRQPQTHPDRQERPININARTCRALMFMHGLRPINGQSVGDNRGPKTTGKRDQAASNGDTTGTAKEHRARKKPEPFGSGFLLSP